MRTALFADGHAPALLRVGDTFPVAAAAGALAHVLRSYDPPRLRTRGAGDQGNTELEVPFDATLRFPLVLGVKQDGEPEKQTTILDPADPFVDDGGRRAITGTPILVAKSSPRMRLIPGGAAGTAARRGRRFEAVRVRETPGRMELEWDPAKQRAKIHSGQVEGTTNHLWIDAHDLRMRHEPSLQPFTGEIPENALAVDGAEDVVVDFGMSKVVALAAVPGWVSAPWLERAVRDGLRAEEVGRQTREEDSVDSTDQRTTTSESAESAWREGSNLLHPADERPVEEARNGWHDAAIGAVEVVARPEAKDLDQQGDDGVFVGESAASGSPDGVDWRTRVSDQEFSHGLQALREAVMRPGHSLLVDEMVVALLALAVRPIVLLAGPPGCGKSTLVRVIAHVLGKRVGHNFHEIPVQAHWDSDEPLFGPSGLLRPLVGTQSSHLVLFDEVNLTRPEYFLSRFFYAVDHDARRLAPDLQMAPCKAFGTLNIDDTSRPPSPKVIDRCFLVELDQVPWDIDKPVGLGNVNELPVLPGLPSDHALGMMTDERVTAVLSALHDAVMGHGLRSDLLPSRRALSDARALLGLHHRLDLEATGLLRREDVVDRVLASRILVKLSGPFEQLQPALDAVEKAMEGMEELRRTRRRLKLARQQAKLGFVSPWQ